jgi:hypothetical protein
MAFFKIIHDLSLMPFHGVPEVFDLFDLRLLCLLVPFVE